MTEKQKRPVGRPRSKKSIHTTIKLLKSTVDLVDEERKKYGESHDACIRRVFGERK